MLENTIIRDATLPYFSGGIAICIEVISKTFAMGSIIPIMNDTANISQKNTSGRILGKTSPPYPKYIIINAARIHLDLWFHFFLKEVINDPARTPIGNDAETIANIVETFEVEVK